MNKEQVDSLISAGLDETSNEVIEDSFAAMVRLLKQKDKTKANYNTKLYMQAIRTDMATYIFSKIPLAAKLKSRLMVVLYLQLTLYGCIAVSLLCAIFGWGGISYVYPICFAVASFIINGSLQSYLNIRLASILYYIGYLNAEDGLLQID